MPKTAMEPSAEVTRGRTLLASYLARAGSSESELSRRSGVPQYTVSKFLNGRIKSMTPPVKQLLKFAEVGIDLSLAPLTSDPRIQRALGSAWDGTEQGVALLASAIDALAPVIRDCRRK